MKKLPPDQKNSQEILKHIQQNSEFLSLFISIVRIAIDNFLDDEKIKGVEFRAKQNLLNIPKDLWVASKLSFECDSVKGFLEIVVDMNFGTKTWPVDQTGSEKPEGANFVRQGTKKLIIDWVGEISNRILSKIGRQLSLYEIGINLGTPIVVDIPSFGEPCPLDETRLQIPFVSPFGQLHAFLQFKILKDIKLEKTSDESELAESGEIVSF